MSGVVESLPIVFGSYKDLGAPWKYVAEEVFFQEEDPGQGSHPPFTDVATLLVHQYNEPPLEVILGNVDRVDRLIEALRIVKQRMIVSGKRKELAQYEGSLHYLESQSKLV